MTKSLGRVFLIFIVVVGPFCLVVDGQVQAPITKANFFSSIRLGKKEKKTAARYIELIKHAKVDFLLTPEDERSLRRYGSYLGQRGLDELVAVVRSNYRGPVIFAPADPNSSRLSFLRSIPHKSGPPQRLDVLMKTMGYTGSSAMSALIVASDDANTGEIIVGTSPNLSAANGQLLYPSDSFNFPGGEDTSSVYIICTKDCKIDVTYRVSVPSALESVALRGVAILKNGQATIYTTAVTTTSRILLTGQDEGVSGTPHVQNIRPGMSFDIVSTNGGDNGVVFWVMYRD